LFHALFGQFIQRGRDKLNPSRGESISGGSWMYNLTAETASQGEKIFSSLFIDKYDNMIRANFL